MFAAEKCLNVANMPDSSPEVVSQQLHNALVNLVLAPSGPRKNRLLTLLASDERLKKNQHFAILDKMF